MEGPSETLLNQYRTQTMKDYSIMIEYKNLKQHVPSGIYVLPSFDDFRVWHGVIFIRHGLYQGGVFKFRIELPKEYVGHVRLCENTSTESLYVLP